ncbi:MAG TPA: DUF1800 family protein, partial [Gammaproteobacteria bacterium]|nr:DUF1800 family protein [Gammaproteobacteria bacterium]
MDGHDTIRHDLRKTHQAGLFPHLKLLFLVGLLLQTTMASGATSTCHSTHQLPPNQWQQISLPCDPGATRTVADVLGDDISGTYGQDWAVFGYNASQARYSDIGESGVLSPHQGYWIIQLGPTTRRLDISGTTIATVNHDDIPQCPAVPGDCANIPLTNTGEVTWNMVGYPLIARLGWQQTRVTASEGICAASDGCSIDEAATANVLHNQLWHYDANTQGYRLIENNTALKPWEGFWSATLGTGGQPGLVLPTHYGGYEPADQEIARFDTIEANDWDETAVRKVLYQFAYGGQASAQQIEAWANLTPENAIIQMLTFDGFNPLLSPLAASDTFNLGATAGTLSALGEAWSSSDADNDVDENDRSKYDVSATAGLIRPNRLWERAIVSRGVNPFRQKVGLWETNYHLSTNLATAVTGRQMLRYYDDILRSLSNPQDSYADTLTTAALSAAIARQYGHDKNIYKNGSCQCNEDFAREYHQLFFGILGEDNPEYHETVSIKNTAKALTDMPVLATDIPGQRDDHVTFGTTKHWPGELEILHASIGGSRADERIAALSSNAIEHPESLNALPVMIISGLADDRLDATDIDEIRHVWSSMSHKNLLHFLRGYAISKQFHDASRVKYLSSFDRNITLFIQTILNNREINLYDARLNTYEFESVKMFYPKHNVFGGQTGLEAAASSDIFRLNYNRATEKSYYLLKYTDTAHQWKKDWAAGIPGIYTDNYRVDKIGEFLWNRYIGDSLKNYGVLERTYINALLATNNDWAAEIDPEDLNRVFTTSELTTDQNLITVRASHASTRLALDSTDPNTRQTANIRIGKAINFITAT